MLVSLAGFSPAQETHVEILTDYRLGWDEELESVDFVFKKKKGRAAVEVTLFEGDPYEPEWYSIIVPVEGLHYDRDRRQVRWDVHGPSIVCAQYGRGWPRFKETGECPFEVDKKLVVKDDGWNITRYYTLSVQMSARTPPPAALEDATAPESNAVRTEEQ